MKKQRKSSPSNKGESASVTNERQRLLQGIGVPKQEKFEVDDFQKEAISSVVDGRDTLVIAPTGSGKTYIAVEAISALLELGLKAIYTTPLKALSNTKYNELKARFEPKHKVGLLTGDRKIDTDADCVVATTEIYRNELYRDYGRYSLVVLDEVHYISDLQRGPVWEESIILTPKDSTLLMLSASISNPDEIASWLQAVREKECRVVIKEERPVELRLAFLHPDLGVLPLRDSKGKLSKYVSDYYAGYGLDRSGMRLRGSYRGGGGQRSSRGRSRSEGGSSSRRKKSRRS